ncbi:MAG TPA: magnesium-translocating P-type ATPase [Steroidobacteraceae bacterium]|nr:magnesium-translocating P-type ATPase [Steroidobacteraceae bacterium]
MADLIQPWSKPAATLLSELGSSRDGLAGAVAAQRLRDVGPNTLREDARWHGARLLLAQFGSPLGLILIAAAAIAALVGELQEALIILAIVLASSLLSFYQEYRASQAVGRLLARLAHRVDVLRDGRKDTIAATALVPGDVVLLAAGTLIPADAIVLEATDLDVTQAALTGEPFPVSKQPGTVPADAALPARSNMVFAGTSVRSGTGRVLVVATGARTGFAAIAGALARAVPETGFMRGVRRFGVLMTQVVLGLVILIFAANLLLHRPLIDSLLFSLALAVGMTPELLPAIVSVTLSRGARVLEQHGVIVRRLQSIENLGSMDVLCTDKTGTLTEGVIRLHGTFDVTGSPSAEVLRLAAINATLQTGIDNPLDEAIRAAATNLGPQLAAAQKIDEIPYDFARKRLSVIVRDGAGKLLVCKGALRNVLDACAGLSADSVARIDTQCRQWSEQGFRVLGLATCALAADAPHGRDAETGLTFAGFLLFQDSAKEGVQDTLQRLAALGLRVKMVTGDNRYAAAHLAREVGLGGDRVLTGETLAQLSNEALFGQVEDTDVFAEIDPAQKERVIQALQRHGHVVGHLGDGINDAPALHAADVGISVDSAVDVAREAADIVLLEKSLAVLLEGIAEGRRTFANTMKYVAITTSANFGNMISMAAASLLLPFLPLLAKQILLNNFLSDLPALAISTDRVDAEAVARPHGWDIRYIRRFMIGFGSISSLFDFVTFGFLLLVIHATAPLFRTSWFVLSLLTQLGIVYVARTRRPAWRSRPGRLLVGCSILVAVAGLAMPWLPFGEWMGFVHLPARVLAGLAAITLAYLVCSEVLKRWLFGEAVRQAKP